MGRVTRSASRFAWVASTIVTVTFIPAALLGQVETAGEVFVDLDAGDATAGTDIWENRGTLGHFIRVGEPAVIDHEGAPAVSFNGGFTFDAYQCEDDAPAGLVGIDPTRSIEVWAFNPDIAIEETLVAWGRRGGPLGSNMSFNYGTSPLFGAVGHWGDVGPDLGWGVLPSAGKWHHLVYTYDGATTRVYADGVETAFEDLGPGALETHCCTKIALAAQYMPDGIALDQGGIRGTLSLGRLRIHDEVLTPEQIQVNYDLERPEFPLPEEAPLFADAPSEDFLTPSAASYVRQLTVTGYPAPVLEVLEPTGATITPRGLLSYPLPDPRPVSFGVRLRATNRNGVVESAWTVTILEGDTIQVAEELFVDLDAADGSAGDLEWTNNGSLGSFIKVGEPQAVTHLGVPAVQFNAGITFDAYQCADPAPDGLIGIDPTRSIEAWVFNPQVADEETVVAWGRRGGPDGSNMSFNYGVNNLFGAVGHWGGNGPDLGWGAVPSARAWHHLAYTYDGSMTRVYVNGVETASEALTPGLINTHCCTRITLAAQYLPDGINLDTGAIKGTLSIGRLRIHDGVLSPAQILSNFFLERDTFIRDLAPTFLDAPAADEVVRGLPSYNRLVNYEGFPTPTLEVLEPPGGIIDASGLFSYAVPNPAPASFVVRLRATNSAGSAEASWTVTVKEPNTTGEIEVAGELFVDLDANDPTAGSALWENQGTLAGFVPVGSPAVVEHFGAPAVSFNGGATFDAYQCEENAPLGLVGLDPTRSIEVWAFNPDILAEETLVAWGRRGGGPGTNMSFNYGTNNLFGAVGHWDAPDLSWGPATPAAGRWHHLVYTYDGTTTRVYADGAQANQEILGAGVINTHPDTRITLAAQILADGIGLDMGVIRGSLSLGQVRIHDEVLTPEQILNNYLVEKDRYPLPPTAAFTATPELGEEPLQVSFDATPSTSPNGVIQSYEWDFGDGDTAQGAVLQHTYDAPGRYAATLTVTDGRGASASASRSITVQFRPGDVAPWISTAVGDTPPTVRGGARPSAGGCTTVYAGGRGITARTDQFHFLHRPLTGNARVTARIAGATLASPGRLGVMLREDLTPGSRHAFLFLNALGSRFSFIRRDAPGGITSAARNSTGTYSLPDAWLRIERVGDEFIGSYSTDGTSWTELGRATMTLPAAVLGGIAASSHDSLDAYVAVTAEVCDLVVEGSVSVPSAPTGLVAVAGNGQVNLDWNDNAEPSLLGYNLYRRVGAGAFAKVNAAPIATSSGIDAGLANGVEHCYQVRAVNAAGESPPSLEACATPGASVTFRRGDADSSGGIDLSDAIGALQHLFLGGARPVCWDAADTDDNGVVDISDPIANLQYQFLGGAAPAAPGPTTCGPDAGQEDPDLGCERGC